MNDEKTGRPAGPPADPIKITSPGPGRRQVMAGMAAASVVSALPLGAAAGVGNPIFAFLRISSLVTGIPLDKSYTQLGETILAALLSGEDQNGIAEWANLAERLETLSDDATGEAIEQALPPSLLAKARKLARVWYTGQIERPDGRIDVIDYDEALVWRACTWTKPPATCGGPFGYWHKPGEGGGVSMVPEKTPTEVVDADIVVVGAGLVGGLMSWDLSLKGLNVAMLDSGPLVDRAAAVRRFKKAPVKDNNAPYVTAPYAPSPGETDPWDYYVQKDHDSKDPLKQVGFTGLYIRNVGGTSWHFTGHAERMYPNDFRMKSAYGRGLDWPISYDDLVPYYQRVERAWGVAGNETCVAPEPQAYPLPVIPLTYLDEQVNKAAVALGDAVGPLPQCRNSVPYDFRPQCCGNASCVFICPIGAKYDGSVHVMKAETVGARLYHSHVVYKVEVGTDGKIKRLHYANYQDENNPVYGVAKARVFVIAAHGIETPRLLLLSKGEHAPNGVANSSDQVGRNLMSMGGVDSRAYVPEPVYPLRGPVNATGAFRGLRDGPFRKDFACIETIVINGGFDETSAPITEAENAIKAGLLGKGLRNRVRDRTIRQVYLDNAVEMLPNPDNRISLAKERTKVMDLPRPKINFKFDEYAMDGIYQSWVRSLKVLTQMGGRILNKDGDWIDPPKPTRENFKILVKGDMDSTYNDLAAGHALISGTCRMGADAKTSVVDPWCRSHDHENLFIVGTCNYVTSGVVSPSETAAALGLRAADHIAKTFNLHGE